MSNPFERDWMKEPTEETKNSVSEPSITSSRQQQPSSYADITILLDKSSSMNSMRNDILGGYNEVISSMRKDNPGNNRWSMLQFDDLASAQGANQKFPHVVFDQLKESELKSLTPDDFVPRGSTALIDACCKTIEMIDGRVSGQEKYIKPVIMIMTDGEENCSRQYKNDDLRKLIANRQEKGWQFLYYGANQDSFGEAGKFGIGTVTCSTISGASYGGLSPGSSHVNNFGVGMASGAVGSGMIGLYHLASGSLLI